MSIITIDLGTTNTKVTEYNRQLETVAIFSRQIKYFKDDSFVEFDPEVYLNDIKEMIEECTHANPSEHIDQIIITGQAETLVVLDSEDKPLLPIISWLDKRSVEECDELNNVFHDKVYQITGQPEFIPTWPVSKILWIKKHRPEVFNKINKYLLLQDFVVFFLTGKYTTEYTIAGFSCYFDIINKNWWKEILDYVGIRQNQLPQILPPNTIVAVIKQNLFFNNKCITKDTFINSGLLDHFAGMIGTGNIKKGIVSESAGTVLSLATFVDKPIPNSGIPTYCGPFPSSYVLLPVCESGGICLEWFRNEFMKDMNFSEIDEKVSNCCSESIPIFLPYVAGTNAPYFNKDAKGVFFGFTTKNSSSDFALAIMRGVACMLRENIAFLEEKGIKIDYLLSTGGGAKSQVWSQIKSDFSSKIVKVPSNKEGTSLGAAILAAVQCHYFSSLESAIEKVVSIKKTYTPTCTKQSMDFFKRYQVLYATLKPLF